MFNQKRWLIILSLFVANAINYVDRVNISVAGSAIAKSFDINPSVLGVMFSSFFYIYVLLILPMGLLTDKYGARTVMSLGMIIWAIGSAATGFAMGISTLIAARLFLGVGESSSYPAGNRIVREWAPRNERGVMVAVFNAGSTAGPALGIIGTSTLLTVFEWQTVFFMVAAATLVFALLFWAFYRSPERAPWLSGEERSYILAQRDPTRGEAVQAMSLAALLKQRVMWGLLLTHGCQVYSIYLFLTWLPSYLLNVRHMPMMQMGWFGMLPYLAAAIGSIAIGAISDATTRHKDLTTGVRRKMMMVTMVLAAAVLFVPFANDLWMLEILLIASVLFASAANGLNYALAGDMIVDKSSAGVVYGLLVLGGNLFGLVAPILTGFIISTTGAYTLSFLLAAILLLAGIIISWTVVCRPLQPINGLGKSTSDPLSAAARIRA